MSLVKMPSQREVTVRLIAFLDSYQKERGRPTTLLLEVPTEGKTAREIANELELPLELIEGVFLNHRGHSLDVLVCPGDRVAFVPRGTPASHPAFFGSFDDRDRV